MAGGGACSVLILSLDDVDDISRGEICGNAVITTPIERKT